MATNTPESRNVKNARRKAYRFIAKDPIMDVIASVIDGSGMNPHQIALRANGLVSPTTIYNWGYGKVRRPTHSCLAAVMESCSYREVWEPTEAAMAEGLKPIRMSYINGSARAKRKGRGR